MEFLMLGPLEVRRGGERIELRSHRQRSLLALLLIRLGRVVATDQILEEIWGEDQPSGGSSALAFHLSRLRTTLEPDRRPGDTGSLIVTQPPGYKLDVSPDDVDAHRFEELVHHGRAALTDDSAAAAETLRRSLGMWRGPALADLQYESFAQAEIHRLEELRLLAIEGRIAADLDRGLHEGLIGELEALLAEHPLREVFHAQLMTALYRSGRQAEALRAYRTARQTLGEQLGIEPSLELQHLEEQILRQDPALTAPAAVPAASLPTGTVTFLFTDLEGSTKMWERHREEMPEALARHDTLLEEAISGHRGRIFKHTGDGMCAVFPSALDGVRAAVDVQRGLQAEDWGRVEMRARAALHTGEAEPRSGDYFGPALNRVARLTAAAHGGQILVTAATAEALRDVATSDIVLRPLGEHVLPDLARPEQILQVIHPELPSAFPPVRSAEQYPHNLPVQLTSFVGRVPELAELVAAVDRSRLVTLTGPGGAGKTRLAIQAGRRLVRGYPNGTWFISLDSVTAGDAVARTFASTLGIVTTAASLEESIVAALRPQHVLLVVDNCEQVVDAVAGLVARILATCPRVSVIATSRESLAIRGETLLTVGPMTLPGTDASGPAVSDSDAIQLFIDRAVAADSSFALTPENAEVIAHICRELDGLPLAIELAAARSRLLTPQQIADRLDDRFATLGSAPEHMTPRRQRTLEATVGWSYDLLSEPERTLFQRLSVFRGGWTMDLAEAVCTGGEIARIAILDLLGRLLDKSLVSVRHQSTETRYRLLDTLRLFAARRLDETGESAEIERRHAEAMLDLAEAAETRIRGPDEARVLADLDAEWENIRAAVERSLRADRLEFVHRIVGALSVYLMAREHAAQEARSWLGRSLGPGAESLPLHESKAAYVAGTLAWDGGDLEEAAAWHARSLELARESRDPERSYRALNGLGLVAVDRGDVAGARELFTKSLGIARRTGDPEWIGAALSLLAQVEQPQKQAAHLRESLGIQQEIGRLTGTALVKLQLGYFALAHGEVAEAQAVFGDSAAAWEQLENKVSLAVALCALADAQAAGGAWDAARAGLLRALDVAEEVEVAHAAGLALYRLADNALAHDETGEAAGWLDRSHVTWSSLGAQPGSAVTLGLMGDLSAAIGEPEEAAKLYESSAELWEALQRPDGVAWLRIRQARTCGDDGDVVGAARLVRSGRNQPIGLDGWLSPEVRGLVHTLHLIDTAAVVTARSGRDHEAARLLAFCNRVRLRAGLALARGAEAWRREAHAEAGTPQDPPPEDAVEGLSVDGVIDRIAGGPGP